MRLFTRPTKTFASACLTVLGLVMFSIHGCVAATYYSDPVSGTVAGDGSFKRPWPRLEAMVRSGKLPQLQGGDTLLLRDGDHGNAKFSGDNAALVTIAAAPGQSPHLSRLEISKGSHWLVKGLTISPSFSSDLYAGNMLTFAEGGPSSDISIEDCFIYTELDSSGWTKEQWMNANSGIFMGRNGTHLTLRNNYILNTRFAVQLCAPDSLCEANTVANFSGDGIRITRDGLTVQFNTVKNAYLSAEDGDANHDDLIQCFLFNKGTGTVSNVTVRGNILIGNEDENQPFRSNPQGLGFFDGPLVNFLVEGNVVKTNTYHGISLYDAVDCQILNNVVSAISVQKMMPWIMLNTKNVGGSRGNIVKNNMARAFLLQADAGVIAENNVPVDEIVCLNRLQEQWKFINDRFGALHPVAHLPRLGNKRMDQISFPLKRAAPKIVGA